MRKPSSSIGLKHREEGYSIIPDVRIFHYVAKERTEPEFFYKRYYWGGITDYIMSRTLKDVEIS